MIENEENNNKQNDTVENEMNPDANSGDEKEIVTEGDQQEEEESEIDKLKRENAELKDKFLRLYSEFENFRRRTSKERIELVKSAGEDVISALLPVMDDFERALKSVESVDEKDPMKEGILLIHNKFHKVMESKGLKAMESVGKEFDSEVHEAITKIPAPSEDMKGKVVDEVEKGYYLNEKVIRFAKVVIGA